MAEADQPSRALVIGAGGFIGQWVAGALTAKIGARVAVVNEHLRGRDAVLALVRDARPSVIFNLAAYGVRPAQDDAETATLVNERLVAWLIEAMTAAAATNRNEVPRLIHAGTAAEYGESLQRIDESTPELPVTRYGATKLAGTRLIVDAASRGLPAMCARLFMVYGPGEPPHRLVPSLIAAARSGESLKMSAGTQRRDFTYVKDAAEALLRLAALRSQGHAIVNVGTGRTMTVRDFASRAAYAFGIGEERLAFGAGDAKPGMDYAIVDVSLLRALTGWSPPTAPEEGLREIAAAAGLTPA